MIPGRRKQSRRTRIGRSPPAPPPPSARHRGCGRRSAVSSIGSAPMQAPARERSGRSLQSCDPTFHFPLPLFPLPLAGEGQGGGPLTLSTNNLPAARSRLPDPPPQAGEGERPLPHGAFLLVLVLPMPLLLQGICDFLGHVGLVVLGEHVVGPKHAGIVEGTFGDDALPFTEQVRQDALIGDRDRL